MELHDIWPLFSLRIDTERLTLRVPTDDDFPSLVRAIGRGIHDPSMMPFAFPWTDIPSPERERQAAQHWWKTRATWTPDGWTLSLAVFLDGEAIGVQGLETAKFPLLRTGETGSWLGQPWQGKGYGTEMRKAMLHLAFEHLKAEEITSAAWVDNVASNRVSIAAGYEPNGVARNERRGKPDKTQRYVITRERWETTHEPNSVTVTGFEHCRSMFALDPADSTDPTSPTS
jgi:RimJ/RimL family protein N-acetyltransferase